MSANPKAEACDAPIRWDYPARWARIQSALARRRADAFVVRQPGNIRYLACAAIPGSPALSAVIVPREGLPVGIVSSMEASRAQVESALGELIVFSRYRDVAPDVASEAAALRRGLAARRLKRVMADSAPPGVTASVHPLVNRMRVMKDAEERRCLRQSARLAALGAQQLERLVQPGRSELAVAADLEFFLRRHGAQGLSFPTIVATGPHSAFSHHAPGTRKIADGDAVICDFGVYVQGYASDISRTILVGKASKWNGIYRAVRAAQAAAVQRLRPGVPLRAVDDAARGLLRRRKLAQWYVHSTGHGLGLDTHEGPALSPFAAGSARPGMVVTIEPGVYLSGQGGVRIEDAVEVTEDGVEWLTGPVS